MQKQVILLNGPSSGGKSSLAKALCSLIEDQRGERYEIVSIDDHMKLATNEIIYEDDVYEISGDMCLDISDKLKTSPGVIIDHVITSERIFEQLKEAMRPYRLRLIHVTCPLEVLKKREAERGDRCPGSAEASYQYLFPKEGYELTVDTNAMTAEECALLIFRKLFV